MLIALIFQSTRERGELFRRFLVGLIGGRPAQLPRPCPAAAVWRFFNEAVPGELTQMKGTEAGTVAKAGGGLGRRDCADLGKQVQQGDTHRMVGELLPGARRQWVRGRDLTVFIAHFAKGATLQSIRSSWAAGRPGRSALAD